MTAIDETGLFVDDAGKMTTHGGWRVNPLTMTADQVSIADIAHSLSRQCRFNGHVGHFYSVARHSVWVADRIHQQGHSPLLQLTGLLHDAAEAYLGDMIRPLKHGALGEGYLVVEARLEAEIAKRFGLTYPWHRAVGLADNWVLMERELTGENARWTWSSTPNDDCAAFMTRFSDLGGK